MKKITHTLLLFMITTSLSFGQAFITTWKTDNPGTSNDNEITIPTDGTGFNYTVDWGDESSDTGVTGDITHTYASPGTYTITISGDFPKISFVNDGDKEKLLSVEQWGNIQWSGMIFWGCKNLVINATDAPDLSNATSLISTFRDCHAMTGDLSGWDVANITNMDFTFLSARSFNSDISGWDVSNVTTMRSMFSNAFLFNQPIGSWDVSNVSDMNSMFHQATVFNQNINSWDVSEVTDMNGMFRLAYVFNQPLNNWDVSKVTKMNYLFDLALAFNQDISNWNVSAVTQMNSMFKNSAFNNDIGGWDVSKVTDMGNMFAGSESFNVDVSNWNTGMVTNMSVMFADTDSFDQDLSDWDVSKVTNMDRMFLRAAAFNGDVTTWNVSMVNNMANMFDRATNFNQDLSDWDISSVTTMVQMFDQTNLNTTNYDNILEAWSALSVQPDVNLGASGIKYCHSSSQRDILTNGPNNWVITDAGQECLPFVTTWETTTSSEQITIPTTGTGYDYDVDWGDGTVETGFTGDASHTYTNAGVHIVSISGDFPRIYFNNGGDKDKIQTIEQWGDIEWLSMRLAFFGCSNLTYNATDAPNLTNVTSLFAMFFDASSFDGEVGNWDVSNINDMQSLFGNTAFNQDISNWDVSNVTNLSQTFFNTPFNQDIGEWDVSNVTTMQNLFLNASDFNQDISNWDVSKVENFTATFSNASSFNADLSSWNVGLSTNMENMFAGAGSFNQDLSNWDIADVTNMTSMLNSSGLSTVNYDKILQGWATQTVQPNVTLGALNIDYCLGSTARNTLLAGPNNWTINDGNENCVVNIPDANFKAALLANGTINTDGDPTEISYQEAEVVNNVQLAGLNISDLTGIEAFTALNVLAANNNNLTSIDLTNNESLDYLSLSGNDLTEIDLSNNPTLLEVILSNNQLTEIDVTNNTQITALWVDQNDISSIDLSNNLLLEDLRVDRNANLSSLNISANDQLTDLYAYSCNLQNINVSSNTLLQKLFLYANDIISLDLSGLSDLDDLRVGGLSITNLVLSDSPNLRFLRASGMGLTELTLAGTNLVQLFIGDNNLNGSLDLSIYPNLTNVRIEQNNFTDVDLRNGNNAIITNFSTTNNPNLTCISVDNVAFAEANFTSKDSQTLFSTNCSNIANDITAFSFAEQASAAVIGSGTVDIEVALGTDLSSLSPTFTVSSGATADPASGVAQDFSSSFVYTVTAENPTAVQQWTINVLEENVAPTDITLGIASIDENNAIAAVIGTLSTTDGNAADTHSYSLVAGTGDTDNASFDISGSNLIASEVFDFETKTSYSVRVQTNDGRGGTFEKEFAISINDISGQSQAITIAPIIDKLITDEPFDIEASASSGLALTYGISGPATLNGTTVTLDGTAGTVTITVAQAGNEDYLSTEEQVSFDVLENQSAQAITFNAIEDQFLIDESLSLTATASSGLDITYEIVNGPATVNGSVVTFIGLGSVTVKATQDGNTTYLPAEPVEQSFEIVQTSQSITFEAIDDQLFSNGSLTLEATASSGLDVTYDIVSGPATVSGNVVSFTDLGMVTVSASQAGNEAFTAAAVVEQSFTIFKNEQTITFNTIDDQFFEAGSITLSATASSGLEVSYDIVSGPATVTGNVISFSDLGTVVVSANQVGNDSFLAAAAVEQAFDVITVTGVDDVTSALLIYPNPASDVLTIQTQQEDVSIQLLNMTGVKVMNIRANAPNNISHLNDGIYFLRISIGENYTTHKIIKK